MWFHVSAHGFAACADYTAAAVVSAAARAQQLQQPLHVLGASPATPYFLSDLSMSKDRKSVPLGEPVVLTTGLLVRGPGVAITGGVRGAPCGHRSSPVRSVEFEGPGVAIVPPLPGGVRAARRGHRSSPTPRGLVASGAWAVRGPSGKPDPSERPCGHRFSSGHLAIESFSSSQVFLQTTRPLAQTSKLKTHCLHHLNPNVCDETPKTHRHRGPHNFIEGINVLCGGPMGEVKKE